MTDRDRPRVAHLGYEVGGLLPRVAAHLTWQRPTELLYDVVVISGLACERARLGEDRVPFLEELKRELCRVGMHPPSCGCFHVRVRG